MLTKEEAITMALQQEDLQNTLRDKNVLDMSYTCYTDYDSVLNIHVSQFKKKKNIKLH